MYTDIGYLITDFNAKIGKATTDDPCVGKYFRGIRNISHRFLQLENPFVHDENSRNTTDPDEIHRILKTSFPKTV